MNQDGPGCFPNCLKERKVSKQPAELSKVYFSEVATGSEMTCACFMRCLLLYEVTLSLPFLLQQLCDIWRLL